MKILILLLVLSSPVLAQEINYSSANRDNSIGTVMGGLQLINTWVPAKATGSYTHIFNRDLSLEFEYAQSKNDHETAGTDIGTIDEKRYSLLVKYYLLDSFFVSLGPVINDLTVDLNQEIRNAAGLSGNQDIKISTLGLSVGIGNRWQLKNGFTVGIDWLRLNQPTRTLNTESSVLNDLQPDDQQDVKRTGKILKSSPAITYFGVSIGYTF